ncbi:hypothetical protein HN446_03485 [bacterium]|jgi:hypothetical protein|nr:hypothetical protein [bacterium]
MSCLFCKWFEKNMQKFFKLPRHLIFAHIFCKFIFGIGLGMILGHYFSCCDLTTGWILIILSIAGAIPSTYKMLKK